MTKKHAEQIHSKRRALERYDLNLTKDVRDCIRGKIKRGDGTFLRRTSRRVSIWEVEYSGNKYVVAYDKERKELVTFLPEDYEQINTMV